VGGGARRHFDVVQSSDRSVGQSVDEVEEERTQRRSSAFMKTVGGERQSAERNLSDSRPHT